MSLSEYLAEDPEDFQTSVFHVDESNRNWSMRKLARAREEIDLIESQAKEEKLKIDAWVTKASAKHRETAFFFENALKSYMMSLRADGEKSLVLPDGEIHSRAVAARPEIQDKELFIKWCMENGHYDWIREKQEPNLEALRESTTVTGELVIDTATGEVIEGVVGTVSQVNVTVKTYS